MGKEGWEEKKEELGNNQCKQREQMDHRGRHPLLPGGVKCPLSQTQFTEGRCCKGRLR